MIDVTEYVPMAVIAAKSYAKRIGRPQDVECLVSGAFVGLMKAARSFDSSRGVKFETFANRFIFWEVVDESAMQRKSRLPVADLERIADGRTPGPASRLERLECLQPYLRCLDGQEREICVMRYMDGLLQSEIASNLGISSRGVIRKLKVIHEKIRNAITIGRANCQ